MTTTSEPERFEFEVTLRDSREAGAVDVRSVALGIQNVILIEPDRHRSDPAAGTLAYTVDATNVDLEALQTISEALAGFCASVLAGGES